MERRLTDLEDRRHDLFEEVLSVARGDVPPADVRGSLSGDLISEIGLEDANLVVSFNRDYWTHIRGLKTIYFVQVKDPVAGVFQVNEAVVRNADQITSLTLDSESAEFYRINDFPKPVRNAVLKLKSGQVLVLDEKMLNVLGLYRLQVIYAAVKTAVLQSADRTHMVIIPTGNAGNHRALEAGMYRLRFDLLRWRWDTTDPADDINQYSGSATLTLEL